MMNLFCESDVLCITGFLMRLTTVVRRVTNRILSSLLTIAPLVAVEGAPRCAW
jgi:hypothetical protein